MLLFIYTSGYKGEQSVSFQMHFQLNKDLRLQYVKFAYNLF